MYEPNKYLPTINAILSVANLQEISVKKIRNALQELFAVDLTPHKQDINKLILEQYYAMVDRKDTEKKQKAQRKEIEKQDAILAAQLMKESSQGALLRARKVRKKTTDTKKSTPNSGFNREMALSNELHAILGVWRSSRPQVVKNLWAYIKDNDLQNPVDKRQIMCDEKLEALFRKKTVGAFEMNKLLTKHIFSPDEAEQKVEKDAVRDESESEEE